MAVIKVYFRIIYKIWLPFLRFFNLRKNQHLIFSFHEQTARRFCCDREWNWLEKQEDRDLAWIRVWTLKEAYVKYTGTGIRTNLSQIDMLDVLESQSEQKEVWDHGTKVVLYAESIQNCRKWISVFGEQKINTTMCCI